MAYLRARSEQAAAQEIGVHRHTVRNRLARIETLLGTRLDDPDARAELWLAPPAGRLLLTFDAGGRSLHRHGRIQMPSAHPKL